MGWGKNSGGLWAGVLVVVAVALLSGRKAYAMTARPLTLDELRRLMPRIPAAKAAIYLPYLNAAMEEFGISTPAQRAMFLAQLAHESMDLVYFEEIADGSAYEGRADLGNTQPGDGRRYKGRGPIQLTGRANYRTTGRALGLPLEDRPELAADPSVGFRVAGHYWRSRNLGPLADAGDLVAVTRKINGGTNGLEDRARRYTLARQVLGLQPYA